MAHFLQHDLLCGGRVGMQHDLSCGGRVGMQHDLSCGGRVGMQHDLSCGGRVGMQHNLSCGGRVGMWTGVRWPYNQVIIKAIHSEERASTPPPTPIISVITGQTGQDHFILNY